MYPSGWRGSPAKGVGRESGARVQIPPSPFFWNFLKKLLTNANVCVKISSVVGQNGSEKIFQKNKKSSWQTL